MNSEALKALTYARGKEASRIDELTMNVRELEAEIDSVKRDLLATQRRWSALNDAILTGGN